MDSEEKPFSQRLELWLKSTKPNTISSLEEAFQEKSFAVVILMLMFLPSLPIPTGGLTYVFEIIVMLLCVEMIIGRKTIWLPRSLREKKLGKLTEEKAVPFIGKVTRFFERYSRPRLRGLLNSPLFVPLSGMLLFCLALAALLSPPFSGFDTLPSMGAVIICLGIITDDILIYFAGIAIGLGGVYIEWYILIEFIMQLAQWIAG